MKKLVAFTAAGLLAGASAYGSTATSPAIHTAAATRNYDASYTALSAASAQGRNRLARLEALAHSGKLRKAGMKPTGPESNYDSKLGVATFLWAPPSGSPRAKAASTLAYSPVQPALRAETAARGFLRQQASSLRIDREGIDNAKLASVHDLGRGPIIARFQQYKNGLEVYGRSLNVMMDRNYNAVATSGYFAPAPGGKGKALAATPAAFSLGAEAALAHAFADMGGKVMPSFAARGTAHGYSLYQPSRTFGDFRVAGAPRAKKVYYYSEGRYIPAWLTVLQAESADHADRRAYGHIISAVDGKVLVRKNLIANDSYAYRVFADTSAPYQPKDEPIDNNTLDPFTGGPTGDQGRTQSPSGVATLLNSGLLGNTAAAAAAKNDPWLPAGATTTTGNNVVAFANLVGDDGFDSGDLRGAVSSAGTFDYPYTVDTDPTTASQRQAAIVNQFFVDNWLHDFWYDHGFDEASGNAQTDNYGRGGVEGDPIQAQAQDDSGRNNANMETPPDGGSPIQRMFLWDGPLAGAAKVTITSPAIGDLPFNTASFGPHAFTVSGDIVRPESGNETACTAIATDLTGKIALIDRGACNFDAKTLAAQNAGAIGVIIADSSGSGHCTDPADPTTCEPAPGLGAGDDATDSQITIGTVSLSYPDGQKLETASGTVSGSINVQYQPDRDGTMDIQIVAHEFFHHVSNRLVGDAFGLSSTQGGGMGEGWSDFDAMLLTVRPDDAAVAGNDKYQGAYPLSSYVTFNQYFGIRRYPYSTDMTVDPLTFKHISYGVALPSGVPAAPGTDMTGKAFTDDNGNPIGNAEVHATGEIWCATLWEIYASLLNDPRYTFDQARSRMQDYVIEGLKMTPDAPTMLEARDALLAAARATDSGDFALMAKAFAKRGMGVGAIAPDRNDPQNLNAVESFTDLATELQVTDVAFGFDSSSTVLGDADGDGVLDVGETATLSFTIVNIGTQDMAASFDGQLAAASLDDTQTVAFALANGGKVTVPALKSGDSTVVKVPVTLSSASGTAVPVAFTLSFPDSADPTQAIPEGATVATGVEYDTYVNYDLTKTATSDDVGDVTANLGDWALSNNGTVGPGWEIDDFTGFFTDQDTSGNAWYGPDNDHASDITLTSPEVDVGSADFKLDFDHIFAFEVDGLVGSTVLGYDGGVIEVSIDGGQTWNDAFGSTVGGTVTTGNGYNGVIYSLLADGTYDPTESSTSLSQLHAGFVDTDATDPEVTALEHVTVDFGTKLAGKKVLVRFREVSDPFTGVFGWVVDNIAFTGASNKPFSSTVADAAKAEKLPVAVAASPTSAHTGKTVGLDGSGSSDPFGAALTYAWTQTAGPTVALSDATAAKPSFKPSSSGTYTFQLIVTDTYGKASTPATTSVKVTHPSDDGGAFNPLLLSGLALAALARKRRALK